MKKEISTKNQYYICWVNQNKNCQCRYNLEWSDEKNDYIKKIDHEYKNLKSDLNYEIKCLKLINPNLSNASIQPIIKKLK